MKIILQQRNGDFWITTTQHNGWDVVDSFDWKKDQTESVVIEWLIALSSKHNIPLKELVLGAYHIGRGSRI